jgi:hypothetical protein
MTKVFNHTQCKYIPDPENPRLLSENEIGRENSHHWPVGLRRSFAERLLSKFPKWQCVQTWAYNRFIVANGTEYLGEVKVYDGKIELKSHRIYTKRVRKGGMLTKDPDKAFKLVCKYFSTKTKKERMSASLLDTKNWVQGEQYNTSTQFRMQLTNLAYAAKDYIMQDLGPYRAAAHAAGYDMTKCSQIENLHARSSVSLVMKNLLDKNLGSIIMREGNGYLISDPDGTEILSVDDALLPGPVREALGKLKLMDNYIVLEGVGVRMDTDTFFIVVK